MFKLVIFDLDGTLVDSRRDIANSVNHMLGVYGLPTLPPEVIETYVGLGADRLVRLSMGGAAQRHDIKEAVRLFRTHYVDHCLDTTVTFPMIIETLELLAAEGTALAILTNKPSHICRRMVDGLGLAGYFGLILGPEEVPSMKPSPEAAEPIFRRYPVGRDLVLMVGDSKFDTDFARNVGIRSLLVGYGGITPQGELLSAGADFFCKTPEDLYRFFKTSM
ncbi:MAG: HAD hydrolase-like protein [Myxococcota bacterium]|jgi:phosphoglycolate phosphatase